MNLFNDDHRYWQDRFDSRRVADRIDELLVSDRIDDNTKSFIESRDMFFLATCDADGNPQCSYKGGDPGFVRVVDEQTIAFPSYDGNGMFLSLGNIRAHANVGMLFIDFESPKRVRVNGCASLDEKDPLLSEFPGAQLLVRVQTQAIFANCPRYIHRMSMGDLSVYTPGQEQPPPEPAWKSRPEFCDVLPPKRT